MNSFSTQLTSGSFQKDPCTLYSIFSCVGVSRNYLTAAIWPTSCFVSVVALTSYGIDSEDEKFLVISLFIMRKGCLVIFPEWGCMRDSVHYLNYFEKGPEQKRKRD